MKKQIEQNKLKITNKLMLKGKNLIEKRRMSKTMVLLNFSSKLLISNRKSIEAFSILVLLNMSNNFSP